ncbi:hypothetical protein QJS10_CPA01g00202 [Acorus calamus]|uniref:Ubiquitin fusion degradation protein UFD1 N-terminal subdomain 2 domain-containing protein n=1 Tax=Acorus calamus TaxID=4465 RepID=A0AAV9FKR3_ACOCL|nr:hypothetical protein QJS10_CPA01g00202 [Acorus calamus]
MMAYNNKKYYINIIETKPSNAVSIIETDCEVDFAPPLDYKEPERVERPTPAIPSNKAQAQVQEVPAEAEPKFSPFTGIGRRLDGKPLNNTAPSTSNTSEDAPPTRSASESSSSHQSTSKLVFGSNANPRQKDSQKVKKKEEASKERRAKIPGLHWEGAFAEGLR